MKILVGNNQLAKTGGTENYTFALASELKRLGHSVEYFTFEQGEVSTLLEKEGIHYKTSGQYDLVLANHNTVVQALYTCGFTIQTCHGTIPTLEQPSPLADAYVAISEEVRDYLQSLGFKSTIIPNGIDCRRFSPGTPPSPTLTAVLSLSQSSEANNFIKKCCEKAGLKFLQSNKFTDNIWSVEDLINSCDLVVGLGRSVYDALACGRCAVVYDYRAYMGEFLGEGMLTPDNIAEAMKCNCSGRRGRLKFDEEAFIREMRQYSPELASWGREYALKHLNIEEAARKYLGISRDCDYRQASLALKGRLLALTSAHEELGQAAGQRQAALQAELSSVREQLKAFGEATEAKRRKHMRAIRLLLWLCGFLAVANIFMWLIL